MGYHNRRRPEWGDSPKMERAVAAIMLAIIIATLAVFLLVYKDLPFRPS